MTTSPGSTAISPMAGPATFTSHPLHPPPVWFWNESQKVISLGEITRGQRTITTGQQVPSKTVPGWLQSIVQKTSRINGSESATWLPSDRLRQWTVRSAKQPWHCFLFYHLSLVVYIFFEHHPSPSRNKCQNRHKMCKNFIRETSPWKKMGRKPERLGIQLDQDASLARREGKKQEYG